jgi:hypothetical protein
LNTLDDAAFDAEAKFEVFLDVHNLWHWVWSKQPALSRDYLAPFFPNGTLPEGLRLPPGETLPGGLCVPPSGPNSAVMALAVFRASFHLLRKSFTCLYLISDLPESCGLAALLQIAKRIECVLHIIVGLAEHCTPVRNRMVDDWEFLDLLIGFLSLFRA